MSSAGPAALTEECRELLDALRLPGGAAASAEASGSEGDEPEPASGGGAGGAAASAGKKKKRNKRKGKAVVAGSSSEATAAVSMPPPDVESPEASERLKALNKALSRMSTNPHAFWDTQPVPKLSEEAAEVEHGPIEEDKPMEALRQEPFPIPEGFVWSDLDLQVDAQLTELYELLAGNYVEDDDALFRFNYSREFLMWALTPPGYYQHWHIGVRSEKSGKLYGFISGVPAHITVWGRQKTMCEINFLCVHKKLRSKRLAPVLIKEVTRRVNLTGIFQAVYTAGAQLPKPVSACQYWHRSLNPRKLIDVGFSRLQPKMTMNLTERLYRVDTAPKIPGIRPMTPRDVPAASRLLNAYLTRFGLHASMSEEEFAHNMLPRAGVVSSFVVQDAAGSITDLCSFYHLPSTIIRHPRHSTLDASYAFYTVPGKHTLEELYNDILIFAKLEGKDVFNCLDMMDNSSMLKAMKFGPGDGLLHYYLFNWKCPQMDNSKVGLILV